jgi:hypothetical protein
LTLADDGGAKSAAQFIRKLIEMRLPVNLNRHFGGVADDVAVMAPLKVILQFGFGLGIYRPIEVIG